jgi:hypothetical protein
MYLRFREISTATRITVESSTRVKGVAAPRGRVLGYIGSSKHEQPRNLSITMIDRMKLWVRLCMLIEDNGVDKAPAAELLRRMQSRFPYPTIKQITGQSNKTPAEAKLEAEYFSSFVEHPNWRKHVEMVERHLKRSGLKT